MRAECACLQIHCSPLDEGHACMCIPARWSQIRPSSRGGTATSTWAVVTLCIGAARTRAFLGLGLWHSQHCTIRCWHEMGAGASYPTWTKSE